MIFLVFIGGFLGMFFGEFCFVEGFVFSVGFIFIYGCVGGNFF